MADPDPLAGVFDRPFPEQVAYFRNKLGNLVPTQRWDDMLAEEHDNGFMVAGAAKMDLLGDLAAAVDQAITEGTPIETFRAQFRSIVARHGWTGWAGEGTVKGEAWRVGVIYRTNMRTSYMAGRFAQLTAGNFRFWVYHHGGSREPRPEHLSWDGVALPPDHPFWLTHYPPSDWGCSCDASGTNSEAGVRRLGGNPAKELPDSWRAIDPATGAQVGIGRGWDYAPGARVVEVVQAMAEKLKAAPAMLGAHFGNAIAPMIANAWRNELTATRAAEVHRPILAGSLHVDDIAALEARGIAPASAELMVNPGLISGPKALRHEAAGNALDEATWQSLPELLRAPQAVLLDEETRKLIYILPSEGRRPQLAITVDYLLRPRSEGVRANMIVSAYTTRPRDLATRLANRSLTLLRGKLD